MSSNAPQDVQDQQWKPKRAHGIIRRFRRGPGGHKRFIGQQPDEIIRLIVREHWIFYITPVLPLLGALVIQALVVWLGVASTQFGPVIPFLEVVCVILIVGTGLYAGFKLFELWWVNVDVITNKRILTWRGLFKPTRDQTTLDKVQHVTIDQNTLWSIGFSYGTVHIYLSGGKALRLEKVPNPKKIRDAVEGIWKDFEAAKPKKPDPPAMADKELDAVITKLAKKDPFPPLEHADGPPEKVRRKDRLLGPTRTFGGPLRIPCDVHYDAEEFTVTYIQRSRWVLAVKLFIPVLLLIALLVGSLMARFLFGYFAIAFVILLIIIGLIIINYVDDVFILSNKRVIDIERRFVILFEQHDTTTYDKISKVEVKMHNIIEIILDIGDVFVETQGNNPDIIMSRVPGPFSIQDKIYEIQGVKEKTDKIKAANDRKTELNDWFRNVLGTLEKKVTNRGVPNLHSLDLWAAVERAEQFGMKVVPVGELPGFPSMQSGKIVSQKPPPGTLIHVDPEKPEKPLIQVYLSKRN